MYKVCKSTVSKSKKEVHSDERSGNPNTAKVQVYKSIRLSLLSPSWKLPNMYPFFQLVCVLYSYSVNVLS